VPEPRYSPPSVLAGRVKHSRSRKRGAIARTHQADGNPRVPRSQPARFFNQRSALRADRSTV